MARQRQRQDKPGEIVVGGKRKVKVRTCSVTREVADVVPHSQSDY